MTLRIDDTEALDLVVKGGRVFDPSAGLDARLDVGVRYGRIVALEPDLSARIAERRMQMPLDLGTAVVDATGKIVAPGFIDLHTHVYVGVCGLTVPADETSSTTGVTTCVSAGDAGANTIEGFRRLAVEASRTRVLAFLHVSNVGLAPWPAGEATDLDMLDVGAGIRAARQNQDIVVGVKVRMTQPQVIGNNGLEPLRRAVAIAEGAGIPVIMHIGYCPRPIGELLELLRPGDIVTHCFTGSDNTLVENGRLGRGVHEARARGRPVRRGPWLGQLLVQDGRRRDRRRVLARHHQHGHPLAQRQRARLRPSDHDVEVPRPGHATGRRRAGRHVSGGEDHRPRVDAGIDRDRPAGRPRRVLHRGGPVHVQGFGAQQSGVGIERTATSRVRVDRTIRAGIPWQFPLPHPGRGVGIAPDVS